MKLNRSWTRRYFNDYRKQWYDYSGFYTDENVDLRSPLRTSTRSDGFRPPLPYYREITSGHIYTCNIQMSASQYDPRYNLTYRGEFAGAHNFDGYYVTNTPQLPSHLVPLAEMKARSKLKRQDVNLAQAFGERSQTAKLVVDTCKRLHNGVIAARRLDPRGVADALGVSRRAFRKGSPFDLWLEYQYGWKPLLSDVHGSVKALESREENSKRARVCVTGKVSEKSSFTKSIGGASIPPCYVYVDKIHDVTHKVFVRLDYEPLNPTLITATQLGLTNPLNLAWELLPFSFVVDWFYPVGNYLDQLDAALGYVFKGGSCSTLTTMKIRPVNGRVTTDSSGLPTSGYAAVSGKGRQMRFNRSTYSSSPVPTPPLLFKGESNGTHVANGIALLMSAFTKKVR